MFFDFFLNSTVLQNKMEFQQMEKQQKGSYKSLYRYHKSTKPLHCFQQIEELWLGCFPVVANKGYPRPRNVRKRRDQKRQDLAA